MSETTGIEPALRAKGVSFAYNDEEWVLKDISLDLPRGKLTMLMGPSGSGKTTLLKVLAGIIKPQHGQVAVLNHAIEQQNQRKLSSLIGYIPQQLGLVRNLTAMENVLMGALGRCGHAKALLGIFPGYEIEQAQAALDLMGIGHKGSETVFRMSGGERQRVAIARTLLQRPQVVLADEFVSDLDLALASEILGRMRRAAAQEQITFLMSMHRVGLRDFGDHILTLSNGQVALGSTNSPQSESSS
ncbi:MAG TPA: ATP-binding cassette domain-containing protein [Candidatus Binatia bacterium]